MLADSTVDSGLIAGILIFGLGWFILAFVPGYNARKRNHPSKDAIVLLAFIGFFIPIFWIAALVWSFSVPIPVLEKK